MTGWLPVVARPAERGAARVSAGEPAGGAGHLLVMARQGPEDRRAARYEREPVPAAHDVLRSVPPGRRP